MDDNLKSTALIIAERKLISNGWNWNAKILGEYASSILHYMEESLKSQQEAEKNK